MKFAMRNQTIVVTYGDLTKEFLLDSVINKRNISGGDADMTLLNHYLKYKGDEFNNILWDKLSKAHKATEKTILADSYVLIPEILELIDFLDLLDVYHYIKEVYKLRPPARLLDSFTSETEADGRLHREQTFTKNEYLELVALSLIIKIIFGPIVYFVYINSHLVGSKQEYEGFKYIRRSRLFHSPPMLKSLGLVNKLLERSNLQITVIEKNLSEDQIPIDILAMAVFQRLATVNILDDNNTKNLVTILHNYVSSKINNSGDVSSTIRAKILTSGTGDDESTSSVIENYKSVSDLSPGEIAEIHWSMSTPEDIIHNSGKYIKDLVTVEDVKNMLPKLVTFRNIPIPEQTEQIITIINKDTFPPMFYKNITMDGFINLLAVSYVFLRKIGLDELATLITSRVMKNDGAIINGTITKNRLTAEHKEQLDRYFPIRRINNTQTINVAEEWINMMFTSYTNFKWFSVVDQVDSNAVIPQQLKIHMCTMLTYIEEHR